MILTQSKTLSNMELIPIYTDWANKYLAKTSSTASSTSISSGTTTIRDISNDFRDYRLVAQLINVIVPSNDFTNAFTRQISKTTTNLDGLDACLEYLKNIGIDCTKLTKTDIDSGNLGAVLQLLYLLSTFKQKLRQLKKDQKKLVVVEQQTIQQLNNMPPAVTKLPSPHQRSSQNSNYTTIIGGSSSSSGTQMATTSRIQPPGSTGSTGLPSSRIARPGSTSSSNNISTASPSASRSNSRPKTTGLKPPSSSLRPSSRTSTSSGNNNVGLAKSIESSSGYSSISGGSQIQKPQVRIANNTRVGGTGGTSKITPPTPTGVKSNIGTPKTASVKNIPSTTAASDSMLKLKLFNNSKTPQKQKAEVQKVSKIAAPAGLGPTAKSGLRPPTSKIAGSTTSLSKLNAPKVNYRKPTPEIEDKNLKRCSKSSEEESGYAGFTSTSPASSSTEGSFSMHSASSKSSSSSSSTSSTHEDKSPSSDDLTLNASIVTTIRQPVSKVVEEKKPTLAVIGIKSAIPTTSSKKDSEGSISGSTEEGSVSKPTIGVVSPMMTHRKLVEKDPVIEIEKKKVEEEKSPTHEDPEKVSNSIEKSFPPQMPPIRQPPTYEQLLKQGKITSPVKTNKNGAAAAGFGYEAESSTSEDSLSRLTVKLSTTPAPITMVGKEGRSLDRRVKKPKNSESSGYTSESGVAMCAKMREKMKEYDDITRRAQEGYPDAFEDSSSLSSGISDNIEFDDVSTSDLSGVDMATVATKHGDYSHFVRASAKPRNGRPSTSVDSRSRTIAEQENIHKLLSQCRTSQRGSNVSPAATSSFGQHSIRSPGYATFSPHLTVSADKDTMSMHSQTSRRPSSASQKPVYGGSIGFHSLDRKCHLQDFTTYMSPPNDSNSRMAALLSPRRTPKHSYESAPSPTTSLNASGMSRSMVLLETLSPRQPRRHRQQSPAVSCYTTTATSSASATPSFSRRSHSPRAPCARIPLSIASPSHGNNKGSHSARSRGGSTNGIYSNYNNDGFQLYRLSDDPHQSPAHGSSRSEMGSQLSLASNAAYASLNEKYESAIRDMAYDLECYKNTVDTLQKKQDNYTCLFDMFEQKLRKLNQNIEKSNLKPDEACRFKQDIAHLREISTHLASNAAVSQFNDGAGELLRQPSLESVASHRSSMSSSSKSSKQEKISLSSFGKNKKNWIRSSLSKFTKKKKNGDVDMVGHMPSISGSQGALDEMNELKKELNHKDSDLTDMRLTLLDKNRRFDSLKDEISKLKYENKHLKNELHRMSAVPTRASSQASLPFMNDDEPLYDAACSSTSNSQSSNSKRSSGCNSIKVTVNVDLAGLISSVVCPDNEIIVGYLTMPTNQSTWKEIDSTILALFESYLERIDMEHYLNLDTSDAILGYQIGDLKRAIGSDTSKPPIDILQPTTTIRMFMMGADQLRVDSLVLDTLLPKNMILQLVKYVVTKRRLVLAGAAGIGKSKLAKSLAAYISLRNKQSQNEIIDIKIPDENTEELLKVERRLEEILKSGKSSIVILDNIPKNRIAFVASVFANVPSKSDEGPYVLCTVNRYQIPEMQINQNFKMFLLTNKMEGVNGFMLRFLRRRVVEAEYRQFRQTPSELIEIIQFLPAALQAVNQFIEKTNSIDVTIGPRVFLQCPLSIDESRNWFIRLWNDNFVPYMERVAREGKKTFGRCSSFEDPTNSICEKWPWLDGPNPEDVLRRLSLQDLASSHQSSKQQFNPLESLIQLHATKHPTIDNI